MTTFPGVEPGTRTFDLPVEARNRPELFTFGTRDPGSGRAGSYFLRSPVDAVILGNVEPGFPRVITSETHARLRALGRESTLQELLDFEAAANAQPRAGTPGNRNAGDAATGAQGRAVRVAEDLASRAARFHLDSAADFLRLAGDLTTTPHRETLAAVAGLVDSAQDLALVAAQRAVEPISRALQSIRAAAGLSASAPLDAAAVNLREVLALRASGVAEEEAAVDEASGLVAGIVRPILDALDGALDDLERGLSGAVGEAREAAEAVGAEVQRAAGGLAGIPGLIWDAFGGFFRPVLGWLRKGGA